MIRAHWSRRRRGLNCGFRVAGGVQPRTALGVGLGGHSALEGRRRQSQVVRKILSDSGRGGWSPGVTRGDLVVWGGGLGPLKRDRTVGALKGQVWEGRTQDGCASAGGSDSDTTRYRAGPALVGERGHFTSGSGPVGLWTQTPVTTQVVRGVRAQLTYLQGQSGVERLKTRGWEGRTGDGRG